VTQLGLFDTPETEKKRERAPRPEPPVLQLQPDPRLLRQGDFIFQNVQHCTWCHKHPLVIEERIGERPFVTVYTEKWEDHRPNCEAYRRYRITLDDADGHLGNNEKGQE
jgi:hypothetical protein